MKAETGAGTLFLVGTPIGNLEDLTYRAVRVLGEVDAIAAEDTRRTRALCSHLGIHKRIVSYHEHNTAAAGKGLLEWLRAGKSIALVSDAGMPGLSDPGCELVAACHREGIRVTPVPGPTAAVTALVASGLCKQGFIFEGFLPRQRKRRIEILRSFEREPRPVVIYESPKRVRKTVEDISEILPDRVVAIARELTKIHEEVILVQATEAPAALGESPVGEFAIVISGASAISQPRAEAPGRPGLPRNLLEEVEQLEASGMSRMDAIKAVAKEHGMGKRDLYAEIQRLKG